MRARYYDPVTGRFSSEDPSGQGANWYTYASNDPVNLVDPDGRSPYGDLLRWLGEQMILLGMSLMLSSTINFLGYKGLYTIQLRVIIIALLADVDMSRAAFAAILGQIKEAQRLMAAVGRFARAVGPGRAYMAMAGWMLLVSGYALETEAAFIDGR